MKPNQTNQKFNNEKLNITKIYDTGLVRDFKFVSILFVMILVSILLEELFRMLIQYVIQLPTPIFKKFKVKSKNKK